MLAYHDEEWGVPEYEDRTLWEKLMLDGFQAGLSWSIILRKRDAFRKAFKSFDPKKVARFGEVKDLDGKEKYLYPGASEELIEDALRKLAADQQGFFDKPNFRSGVVFSLYALREEMKRRGHTRSYQETSLSLDIMLGSISDIKCRDAQGKEIRIRSPYLPSVVTVSRRQLKDDPDAKWVAHFHPLVTGSIDKVTYRQFNYDLMMRLSGQS